MQVDRLRELFLFPLASLETVGATAFAAGRLLRQDGKKRSTPVIAIVFH
jgi:hypothetical protein